ncbi:hypothetical protein JOQ06_003585, partial [Pogonophryne albipinna]
QRSRARLSDSGDYTVMGACSTALAVLPPAPGHQHEAGVGLPADLSALDEPPSQPKLKKFPNYINPAQELK